MIVSVIYFIIFFSSFILLLVLQWVNKKVTPVSASETPLVSILIAVRNEEFTITRCFEAIANLNYPKNKLEVLIGDDASTDKTAAIINTFIQDKNYIKYISIKETLGQARGKANVLAHLTKAATSDYFFITDADIAVPQNWVQNMLGGIINNTGIVTGITTITGNSLFQKLQAIDWLNAIGLLQIISDLNMPVNTMGNNMLITRQAYEATGGYNNMDFSVTEDIQLFKAVVKKGFGFLNIFDASVLAWSLAAPNWNSLLHQRKRWMQGLLHMPWYMSIILIVYTSFYAFCLPFIIYCPWYLVFGIFLGKVLLQTMFIHRCLQRLHLTYSIWILFLFEFYAIFVSLLAILFFLMPFKIRWKDRKY